MKCPRFVAFCAWLIALVLMSFGCDGGGTSTGTGTGGTGGTTCDVAACPPPSGECVEAVCSPEGACTEASKADGTPAMTQTAGDCKKNVCQIRMVVAVADDLDVDGNGACSECTSATHSSASPGACMMPECVAGVCGVQNQADGTSCDDGDACTQADACQSGACTGGPVCVPGETCIAGACIAYIKASNTDALDWFGTSVALSADGNTLAVGAPEEDSNATGIDGNQADNSAADAGAVYVYARNGGVWSQQAYIKASNTGANNEFGWSVALSADGNTLAVGAPEEDSNATGINGDQTDNSTPSGAVYVFTRSGGVWTQQAYVKASNTELVDGFGLSAALSADGNTLAVGAPNEDSKATGIDGDQADNSFNRTGAVYVFTRSGAVWSQQAYVKASNTEYSDEFGYSVVLSGNGNTLAVGA